MTTPIGVPFLHQGREIVAVQGSFTNTCKKCMFKKNTNCIGNPPCSPIVRKDSNFVYFVPVEEYMIRRLKGKL